MFIIAGYLNLPVMGFILFITIGHIWDVSYPHFKVHFENKLSYQRSSSDCIFLLAYSSYILELDPKKSAAYVLNNCTVDCNDSVESLFNYYATTYMQKNRKNYELIDKKLAGVKKMLVDGVDDSIGFFGLIEGMFDDQTNNATSSEISMLKKIANIFDIDYVRAPKYQSSTQESTQQKYSYDYEQENKREKVKSEEPKTNKSYNYNSSKSSNNSYKPTSSSSYVSEDVKDAFSVFGLCVEKDQSLVEVKRIYKQKVKKLHPDILKGQNASVRKLAEAEEKLVELNKSIDIVKKFLANS